MNRDIQQFLIHARESFDTIYLEWVADYNTVLLQRAFERSMPDLPGLVDSGAVVQVESRRAQPGAGDGNQHFRHESRVWWRKLGCWRDDIVWEDGATAISIVCGAISSYHASLLNTLTTNRRPEGFFPRLRSLLSTPSHQVLPSVEDRLRQIPLIEPSFLARGWDLTILGDRRHAGRDTLRVKATRIMEDSRPALWASVAEYEVLIDQERGVLLRYAGIVDGEDAGVLSVRSVRFDEPIPDDVFSYHPPEGTRTVWA
jgi:hypothetical protein